MTVKLSRTADDSGIARLDVNQISPGKLLNSKWTAVAPARREKHFVVTEVEFDDAGTIVHCAIEAVISKRTVSVEWRNLQDTSQWMQGWK
jgi:tryptophan-rich hypothetical protein